MYEGACVFALLRLLANARARVRVNVLRRVRFHAASLCSRMYVRMRANVSTSVHVNLQGHANVRVLIRANVCACVGMCRDVLVNVQRRMRAN